LTTDLSSVEYLSTGSLETDEILKTLENLFLGFQSVGGQRTWCAASFLPIAREVMLAGETLWNETAARRAGVHGLGFGALIASCTSSHSAVIFFLARGGELLYLQLL
jgi:hypothetical protein